jgi:hypothetical protein
MAFLGKRNSKLESGIEASEHYRGFLRLHDSDFICFTFSSISRQWKQLTGWLLAFARDRRRMIIQTERDKEKLSSLKLSASDIKELKKTSFKPDLRKFRRAVATSFPLWHNTRQINSLVQSG